MTTEKTEKKVKIIIHINGEIRNKRTIGPTQLTIENSGFTKKKEEKICTIIADLNYLLEDLVNKKNIELLLTSRKKIGWKCNNCFLIWEETVTTRKRYHHCPSCQIRKPGGKCIEADCKIAASFNYFNHNWVLYCNTHKRKRMINVLYKSKRISECNGWCSSRRRGIGNTSVCDHNNLETLYPELVDQWDYEINKDNPEDYLPGSDKIKFWICPTSKCSCHKWEARICSRTSGRGCPFCNKNRPCKHANFAIDYQEIASEWDYELNDESPTNFSSGSDKIVNWICSLNLCGCHKWKTNIFHRTNGQAGCPYCSGRKACKHVNFAIDYQEIVSEWDYELNKNPPEYYKSGSNEMINWICSLNPCGCHKWKTSIFNRTSGSSCPFCNSGKVCKHVNFAIDYQEIASEWNYELNDEPPANFSSGSGKIVNWICSLNPCGCNKWKTSINNRTNGQTGCPFCNKSRPCKHANFAVEYQEIASEWDYELNDEPPTDFSPSSNKIVNWICSLNPCGCHKWKTSINAKTNNGNGCPFCYNGRACKHNNITVTHLDVMEKWNYKLNTLNPIELTYGSGEFAHWICDSDHETISKVSCKTRFGGCSACTRFYSKISIKWMKMMMEEKDIYIQHAENGGEFRLPRLYYRVDGYCKETNTVYEFHGDYWHGNPNIYSSESFNARVQKTFGELYQRTINREKDIISAGFNLITMWENDYYEKYD